MALKYFINVLLNFEVKRLGTKLYIYQFFIEWRWIITDNVVKQNIVLAYTKTVDTQLEIVAFFLRNEGKLVSKIKKKKMPGGE